MIVPLVVLVQRFRGAYPSALTRLFVFRPFWYVQLAAPLVAIGALVGFLIGLPFGIGLVAARWTVVGVGTLFVVGAVAGYIGSRCFARQVARGALPSPA